MSKEITTSEPAALPRNDSAETREITTSGIRPPRNDRAETKKIITSEPAALPRNDVMDSAVIASHIKIRKIIMSFPARCCAFVRSGIFAPARVLEKHSSCRFLDYIGKSCLMREITTSHSVSAPRNDEPYPTTSRLSSLLKMTFPVVAFAFVLSFAFIGGVMAAVTCTNNQTCGTDCCWVVENGTLKITGNENGTGKMEDYKLYKQPWYEQREEITAVEVSGISNLGNRALHSLQNVTSISLSDSVKTIGNRAFVYTGNNKMIDNLVLPKNLTTIDDYAFYGANGIRSITIPDTVTNIGGTNGSHTFAQTSTITTINIPDTLSAENVAQWASKAFDHSKFNNINCLKADGSAGGNESKCMEAMERFLPDENGNCKEGIGCLKNLQKIGNSCVGQYFSNGENTCISKSSCVQSGNVIKFESRECMSADECKETYTIDSETHHCNKIAGCSSFVDGACVCDKYYYNKEGGCVYFKEGCGEGWLEKDSECIEASKGCGENYRDLGGWCNRVIYTPAEAAEVLNDDNTNFITITFRK